MRSSNFRFLLALLFFASLAVGKDKTPLPKLVVSAQYVLVTTNFGDPAEQPLNPHIMPEDRQAVADVQNAIEKWGKYTIAYRRQDADLIIVVRKGRVAEALGGARVHVGSRPSNGPGQPDGGVGPDASTPSIHPEADGDFGDPQDMIALYSASLGTETNSPPLWRGRRMDGLNPPQMSLIQELRTKVEAAAKAP